jgi:hypothetical protein
MLWLMLALFTWLRSFVRSRHDLGLEIVALRQQLIVLKRRTKRARLRHSDQKHLRRLIRDYVTYQEDRIHDSLGKGTPYRGNRSEAVSPGNGDLKRTPGWSPSPL